MDFYDKIICSTSTFVDSPKHNPYRQVLIPLALRSPSVLCALQAISAMILSLRESRFCEVALKFYSHALLHLIHIIDEIPNSTAAIDEACALSVLLCWFEVYLQPAPTLVIYKLN